MELFTVIALDLIAIAVLAFAVYYPRHRRRDLAIAFAGVNQALVAVFGGAGRWIAALVAVLAVAAGIVSTVPGWLSSLAGAMPTAPAYSGMVAALTSDGSVGAALVGLTVWMLLAFIATVIAVARRRSAPAAHPLPA